MVDYSGRTIFYSYELNRELGSIAYTLHLIRLDVYLVVRYEGSSVDLLVTFQIQTVECFSTLFLGNIFVNHSVPFRKMFTPVKC